MNIPFSERDLRSLLDKGVVIKGPNRIVKHPQSTTKNFFKVIENRMKKEAEASGYDLSVDIILTPLDDAIEEDKEKKEKAAAQLDAESDGEMTRNQEEE